MSSKRALRRRSCESKKRYDEKPHAQRDAYVLRRKTGERFGIYRCKWCSAWHVGRHKAGRKAREDRVA